MPSAKSEFMSRQKVFLTLDEALAAVMESDSDDEKEVVTIDIIPPDPGEVTVEEIELIVSSLVQ